MQVTREEVLENARVVLKHIYPLITEPFAKSQVIGLLQFLEPKDDSVHVAGSKSESAVASPLNGWIGIDTRLPDEETPVLLLHRDGFIYEGALYLEKPTFEETFPAYLYFQNVDENKDWEWRDITHWMPKLPLPGDQSGAPPPRTGDVPHEEKNGVSASHECGSVPDEIIELIQSYGDARADERIAAGAALLGKAIAAIRALQSGMQPPATVEQEAIARVAVQLEAERIAQLESELRFERSHIQQLQKALMFWLPMVPDSPDNVCNRTGNDAMLLFGYEGDDEPSAEALGWIAFKSGISSLDRSPDKKETGVQTGQPSLSDAEIANLLLRAEAAEEQGPFDWKIDEHQQRDSGRVNRANGGWHADTMNVSDAIFIAAASPSVIRRLIALLAQRQDSDKDAKRYRWLRDRLSAADFSYSDPPRTVLVFDWPANVSVGGNCDKNIDAAIANGSVMAKDR